MLYLISDGRGRVKIGYSSNPRSRLSGLQTGHADDLVLLATMDGDEGDEAQLHDRFHALRVRGEWYRLCQEIVDAFDPLAGALPPRVVAGRAGRR